MADADRKWRGTDVLEWRVRVGQTRPMSDKKVPDGVRWVAMGVSDKNSRYDYGSIPISAADNYWGAADKPLWECPISNADKTMGVFPLARPTNYGSVR